MNEKQLQAIEKGDPPDPDAGIFGLTFSPKDSSLVLIPVPWDATVSFGNGAATGPKAIIEASHQLDLEDPCFGQPYRKGIAMIPEYAPINTWNQQAHKLVTQVRQQQNPEQQIAAINALSQKVNDYVEKTSLSYIKQNQKVAVVGGDHSSPLGLIKALAQSYEEFGILHIDAHFDLRKAYENFSMSHASIMYNVLQEVPQVKKIVPVGIRDFCKPEMDFVRANQERIQAYLDRDLSRIKLSGESFSSIVQVIINELPKNVYVSFDIDGLSPEYCPSTGTPVPGGLSYHEACYLIEELALSDKNLIGFDLCEVCRSSDQKGWDENVASRILYKLCGGLLK